MRVTEGGNRGGKENAWRRQQSRAGLATHEQDQAWLQCMPKRCKVGYCLSNRGITRIAVDSLAGPIWTVQKDPVASASPNPTSGSGFRIRYLALSVFPGYQPPATGCKIFCQLSCMTIFSVQLVPRAPPAVTELLGFVIVCCVGNSHKGDETKKKSAKMAAIGSMVFCTDCGNLLPSTKGTEQNVLSCECCSAENKGMGGGTPGCCLGRVCMQSENFLTNELPRYRRKDHRDEVEAVGFPVFPTSETAVQRAVCAASYAQYREHRPRAMPKLRPRRSQVHDGTAAKCRRRLNRHIQLRVWIQLA